MVTPPLKDGTANKDILVAIVDALMEKHIMSEDELDAVWQETVKKREP